MKKSNNRSAMSYMRKERIKKSARRLSEKANIGNLKILVSRKGYISVSEDDYEDGMGDTVNSWDFDVRGEYSSAEELVRAIEKATGIFYNYEPSDFVFSNNHLYGSATVNADNEEPSKSEINAWEKGELMLYTADLVLSLEVVSEKHTMTEDEAEAFGFGSY